jgi:hypothetical protein
MEVVEGIEDYRCHRRFGIADFVDREQSVMVR